MPDHYIPAGQNHVFPAGTVPNNAALDNLHNVVGNIRYQIGAAPQVTVPMQVNEPPVVIPVNGVQFSVTNNLPSELLVRY